MRERLILAGLGILMIVAAGLIFSLSRVERPPAPPVSSLLNDHDHAVEILPPAPIGRTLFGGNSGKLRASPVADTSPDFPTGTPGAMQSLEVFAPARFLATPVPAVATPGVP